MFKVLKPFPYSADGMTTRNLAKGDVLDISPDLVEGLKADGFIGPANGGNAARPPKATKGGGRPSEDPPKVEPEIRQVGESWSVFVGENEVAKDLADEEAAKTWVAENHKA